MKHLWPTLIVLLTSPAVAETLSLEIAGETYPIEGRIEDVTVIVLTGNFALGHRSPSSLPQLGCCHRDEPTHKGLFELDPTLERRRSDPSLHELDKGHQYGQHNLRVALHGVDRGSQPLLVLGSTGLPNPHHLEPCPRKGRPNADLGNLVL